MVGRWQKHELCVNETMVLAVRRAEGWRADGL